MTITAGNAETITLDISPYDTDTAVAVTIYAPDGDTVALLEPVATTELTGALSGTLRAEAVAGYDTPGNWTQLWVVTGTGGGVVHRSVYVGDGFPASPMPPVPPYTWPPTLEALKHDLDIHPDDTKEDVSLAAELAAAIQFVRDKRGDDFNWADESGSDLPDPGPDLVLGAIRLAGRWQARKRSPDGMVASAEFGNSRVAAYDADIDRLLGIGRSRGPVIA